MPVCPACQTKLPDNAQYCENCGKFVLSRMAKRKSSQTKDPAGLGGWMILFVLGLITSTITLFTAGIDDYIEESYLSAIVFLVLVIYSIVCLIYMMRHSAAFPVLFTVYACAGTAAVLILRAPVLFMSGEWLSFSLLAAYVPVTLLWLLYRRRSRRVRNTFTAASPPRSDAGIGGPSGIGGLLILVIIGLFGLIGLFSFQIISSFMHIDYIALSMYLILFALVVVCIVSLFRKSRLFPRLFVGLLSGNLAVSLLLILRLYLMGLDVSGILPSLYSALVWALLWITYMLTSKRVKNTFVL